MSQSVRSKYYGLKERKADVDRALKDAAREVEMIVIRYLHTLLMEKRQADGYPMPDKADSTKKAYKKLGWDTEHYLVATGVSTQVFSDDSKPGRIRFRPRNPKILSYHTPVRARDGMQIDWFRLGDSVIPNITDAFNRRLRKVLA